MRRIPIITTALAALLAAGCGGDSAFPEATGKGSVRAINTIATSAEIDFLIEERLIDSVGYKSATAAREYDDLEYTFNFETALPSGQTRVASQFLDVVADRDYIFIVSGALVNPTITVAEASVRAFDETDTVFELRLGHFGTAIGDIDVYLDAPGVAPQLGQQVATLAPGTITDPADYPEGDYVLIYTAAGDPGNELFTSNTLTLAARIASTFSIFDPDANELGQASVRVFNSAGGTLVITDVNVVPTVRFHHASMALATADIYNDDPATSRLIVSNHAFGNVTGDIPVFADLNTFTYTAAGDTAVVLFENEFLSPAAARTNYYIVGETDGLRAIAAIADRRPVETLVKFNFLHAAFNHDIIDFYIVEADSDIEEQSPLLFGLPEGSAPLQTGLLAGSFDIYMTVAGEKTVIAGPARMDIALGDIVELIALDNVDPAIADLVFVPPP